MEELILRIIYWFDSRFQKPLRLAIPDLDELLADPRARLARGEVSILPWTRYGLVLVLTLVVWAISGALLVLLLPDHVGQPLGPVGRGLSLLYALGLPVLIFLALRRLMRGGHCVLGLQGVVFRHRDTEVSCPWSLFSAPGTPVIHPREGRNRFELPVSAAALAFVESRRNDLVIGQGVQVRTKYFWFRSPHEVVLKGIYQVPAQDLAWLLLHLGRRLADDSGSQSTQQAGATDEFASAPMATEEANGWINVSLTRLVFPPRCCACSNPTAETQSFAAHTAGVRFGSFFRIEGDEALWVAVPVCSACKEDSRREYWKAFRARYFKIVAGCTLTGFVVGLCTGLYVVDPMAIPVLSLGFAIVSGILALFAGWVLARSFAIRNSAPLRLERYDPMNGTIAMHFRQRDYALQFLELQRALSR